MIFYIYKVSDIYVNITPSNIHIHDSYKIKRVADMKCLIELILDVDNSILRTRSRKSILREWKAHNVLYKLHILRKSTAHTDIEANQKLIYKICYFILSLFMIK